MTMQLRPYQDEAIASFWGAVRRGVNRSMIGLPTGTGKTVIFGTITSKLHERQRRVLILAHRDELLEQARDKLCQIAPDICGDVGFVRAAEDDWHKPVVLGSVQTLFRDKRLDRIVNAGAEPDLVIVDEAHHTAASSYQNILRRLGCFDEGGPKVLGVTATPQRADSLDLGDTYEELIYHRDMLSMIQQGYLVDLRGIAVKLHAFDPTALRVRAGDYVASEVGEALEAAEAPRHIVGAWQEHAAGRKTIVFTPTVELADQIAERFNGAGIAAANISTIAGYGKDARRAALADFHRGDIQVMTNAMLLTEGFDEPGVECIVIARPTKSQPLYVQMVGRGTRIHPGKSDCLVLDMVGATDRMDLTTLPKLFGLGDAEPTTEKLIEEEGVVYALADREAKLARDGKIVAKRVNLFKRADLAWTHVNDGLWAMSLGKGGGMVQLLLNPDDTWDVVLTEYDPDTGRRGREVLARGLDQGYAMGTAEEYARTSGAARFVSKDAAWRGGPATPGQLNALRKWKVFVAEGLTKGEASDLLTATIAAKGRQ